MSSGPLLKLFPLTPGSWALPIPRVSVSPLWRGPPRRGHKAGIHGRFGGLGGVTRHVSDGQKCPGRSHGSSPTPTSLNF